MSIAPTDELREGFLYGLGAYFLWGLIPLYFKAIAAVPPLEVLAHRAVWSFLFLAVIMTVWGRWEDLRHALRLPGVIPRLALSTVLIAINWATFIHAVSTDQVLQSSQGYFLTPLINVVLGVLFLKERLRPLQTLSVLLATCGMLNLAILGHTFPWIALALAVSFAFYGFLRKTVAADGLLGLFVETMILLPAGACYIFYLHQTGNAVFGSLEGPTQGLLMLSGAVTAVPLLLFAAAARRLRMATLGFMQYVTPSVQFLLAVLAFHEPFGTPQIATFACIWGAVAVYTVDSLRDYFRSR